MSRTNTYRRYTRRDLFVDGATVAAAVAITGLLLALVWGF